MSIGSDSRQATPIQVSARVSVYHSKKGISILVRAL